MATPRQGDMFGHISDHAIELLASALVQDELAELEQPHLVIVRNVGQDSIEHHGPYPSGLEALAVAHALDAELATERCGQTYQVGVAPLLTDLAPTESLRAVPV